jgi:serine/threonine-protein phosphatase 2A regulatory subunit B''
MSDLTHAVLDRVFGQGGRPFTSGVAGKMGYEDFITFFMSEEDKTSESALRYWFGVCDVDGDGVLTARDLRYFYRDQEQRMREWGMEVISFEDVLCQMHDLLKPRVEGRIVITDFLHPDRAKLTGALFSAMFNLSKFQAFEARDPVLVKQELNMQGVSQWDRYAQQEYARLANEEEEAASAAASAAAVTGGGAGGGAAGGGIQGLSIIAGAGLDADSDDEVSLGGGGGGGGSARVRR